MASRRLVQPSVGASPFAILNADSDPLVPVTNVPTSVYRAPEITQRSRTGTFTLPAWGKVTSEAS